MGKAIECVKGGEKKTTERRACRFHPKSVEKKHVLGFIPKSCCGPGRCAKQTGWTSTPKAVVTPVRSNFSLPVRYTLPPREGYSIHSLLPHSGGESRLLPDAQKPGTGSLGVCRSRDQRDPSVSGETHIDSLVPTKDPQFIQIKHTHGESGKKLVETMYPLVAEGIENGLFLPNRASTLCSYCPYRRACEAEYGGTVE